MRTAGLGVRKIRNVRDVRRVCADFVPIPMPHVRGIRPIVSTVPVKVVIPVSFKTPKENAMPAAGIMWLNMWTNLSVLNVKDNGFITPIISDVSRVQTMLIPGSMLLNSLPVWRAGTGHGRMGHAISVPEPLVLMGQHVNNKKNTPPMAECFMSILKGVKNGITARRLF